MTATTAADVGVFAAVVVAAVTLFGFVGTMRGRAWMRGLFKGESLEKVAATMADQMAGVQAAYAVSEAERHRLEAKIQSQELEIADLRKQIEFLGTIVTARDEIKQLSAQLSTHHSAIVRALETITSRLERSPP